MSRAPVVPPRWTWNGVDGDPELRRAVGGIEYGVDQQLAWVCVNAAVVDDASDIREEDGDKHLNDARVRMDVWSTSRLSSPVFGLSYSR
jgi:hypothetical protein